jgi:hypothetical protein
VTGAEDEGKAKAAIARLAEPSVEAERSSSARESGDNQVGASSLATVSPDAAAVDPLGDALAALDRRDYATAQGLFAALGRTDAAAAIGNALAALDRKEYATAQGFFEALGQKRAAAAPAKGPAPATPGPPKPAASAGGPIASDSRGNAQHKAVATPPEIIPFVDAAYRPPLSQARKTKTRRLKSLLLRTGLVLFALCGAFDIYVSPLSGPFATTKTQVIAGLASAVDVLKRPLEAITRPGEREEERSAMRGLSAALTQMTIRLNQIEHEFGARVDKLGERIDQDSSARCAETASRLDRLEKQAALPATLASELADAVARLDKLEKRAAVATAPASEVADITTRLNKLEKRAAVAATPSSEVADSREKRAAAPVASSANPLPPAAPKQSTLIARAEPSASNEIARPDKPRPLLREYSVEEVRNGVAVVDSRYGPQEVAPGDVIPGAGRVLRIERRGGDWFVLTSLGVIAKGPAPY